MSDDLIKHISDLDIQELRLIGGSHILAEVLYDQEQDELLLKDPIEIGVGATGGKTFSEWFSFTQDQYFVIDKHNIIASGIASFSAKVLFCRLVLARNIRIASISNIPQSQEDVSMLNALGKLMSGETITETVTPYDPTPIAGERQYDDWSEEVDTNKVH